MKKKHDADGKKLKGVALRKWYVDNSAMSIKTWPEVVQIRIAGELAFLPILKNQKISGKTKAGHAFMAANPDAMAKIKALDVLYAMNGGPKMLPHGKYGIQITMADQQRADRISVLETVQDWLEPSGKQVGRKKKNRGWGVGLIDDDKHAVGFCFKSEDLDADPRKWAEILIFPWVDGEMQFFGEAWVTWVENE